MGQDSGKCAVCRGGLPAGRTVYCSQVCQARRKKRKYRQRHPEHHRYFREFLSRVRDPLPVEDLEAQSILSGEAFQAKLRLLVERGTLLRWPLEGEVRAVGVPLREGEVAGYVQRRRERPEPRERWEERERRLRLVRVESRRRKRRARAERKAAA